MTQQWVEICEAAGIDTAQMEPGDCFHIAGLIIKDPEIMRLKRQGAVGGSVEFLRNMTEQQRNELRQRVLR